MHLIMVPYVANIVFGIIVNAAIGTIKCKYSCIFGTSLNDITIKSLK
jgi:hypothetical protein